jgi:O-antigen/teichoic acid export membrane protein
MQTDFFWKIKRNHKRTSTWNLVFHYSNILYSIVIGIVLVPLYLKFIPRDIYGLWLATGNIVAWLTIIDPGFSAVLQQKTAYHYGAAEYKIVGNYAFGGIIINLGFVAVIAIIGIIFSVSFTKWLNITDYNTAHLLARAFNYALIGTLLMVFSYILVAINQGLQSSLGIGLIFTIANISGIGLTIILLYNGWSVIAMGASLLCRSIIYVFGNSIYMLWRFKTENLRLSFESSVIKQFTGLSIYNFLGKLGSTMATQLNAFVSSKFLTPIDTTILKFTQTVPETSKLILVRPALAIMPSLTHLSGSGNEEKIQAIILRFLNYLIWGSGLALIGFFIFNEPFITLWVGKSFYGGDFLNALIVLLLFITAFTNSLSSIVFALGNIKGNNIALFLQAVIFVPLLILGVRLWGLKGMIIAAIVAEILVSGWYFPLTFLKKIKIGKETIKQLIYELCKILLISFILVLMFKSNASNWLILIFQIIVSVIIYFAGLLLLSGTFRKEVIVILKKLKCIIPAKKYSG